MIHKKYGTTGLKTFTKDGTPIGEFEAIVASFGNVDSMGDETMPGSWDDSLGEWKSAGDRIPVIWSHDWGDPMSFIGSADPAKVEMVDGVGYKVRGEIDLSTARGEQVFKLMGGYGDPPLVKEFSFAYDVQDERTAPASAKNPGVNQLWKLGLIEFSPTLKGASSDAVLLGVKSDLEVHTKAVDGSAWDGQAAMAGCLKSDNPGAAFRAVCAGRRDGPPDEEGSWALPHHKSPGAAPNSAGVSAALGRFGQTQGLVNSDAAKSHLEAHQRAIEAEKSAGSVHVDVTPVIHDPVTPDGAKAGRVLSAKNEKALREAVDTIQSVLSVLGEEEAAAAVEDATKSDDEAPGAVLRRKLLEKGLDDDLVEVG